MGEISDAIRNRLMHIISGKTKAFWISDKAKCALDGLGVAGKGAVIVLVDHVEKMNATGATYELTRGWRVTVEKIDDAVQEAEE